jgi:hypothetical protein
MGTHFYGFPSHSQPAIYQPVEGWAARMTRARVSRPGRLLTAPRFLQRLEEQPSRSRPGKEGDVVMLTFGPGVSTCGDRPEDRHRCGNITLCLERGSV